MKNTAVHSLALQNFKIPKTARFSARTALPFLFLFFFTEKFHAQNPCDKVVGNGTLVCTNQSAPGSGALELVIDSAGLGVNRVVDPAGNISLRPNVPLPATTEVFEFNGNVLEKKQRPGGAVIYSKTVPAGLFSQFSFFSNACEFGNGFVLFAFRNGGPATPDDLDSLFAIRTDANLNPLQTRFLTLGGGKFLTRVANAEQVSQNRLAFLYLSTPPNMSPENSRWRLFVLDDGLQIRSERTVLGTGFFSSNLIFRKSGCGKWILEKNFAAVFCPHGCGQTENRLGVFVADTFQTLRNRATDFNFATTNFNWTLPTTDGGTLRATYTQFGTLQNDTVMLEKTGGFAPNFSKKLLLPNRRFLVEIVEMNGKFKFLTRTDDAKIHFFDEDCITLATPKPDLELTLSVSNASPPIFSNVVFTLTLKNIGTAAAAGVTVQFPAQSDPNFYNHVAYVSDAAAAGTNFNYWTGLWTLGSLAPGQTRVLTYTGFYKTTAAVPVFSQVQTQTPADLDSAPGNNTTGNPTEDDEARVTLNGATTQPDIALQNVTVTFTGGSAPPGSQIGVGFQAANLGGAATPFVPPLAQLKYWLSTDPILDASDVLIFMNFLAGMAPMTPFDQYNTAMTIPSGIANGQYFLIIKADAADEIAEPNEVNNIAVSGVFSIGSGPSNRPDLELTLTAAPPAPPIWSNVVFTLTLKNNGMAAASGVTVKFPAQSDPAFYNPVAYVSSAAPAGTTFDYWTGVWTVGNLPAGQSKTLIYTGFMKTAAEVPVFSQVQTQSPADLDSAPGNNSSGTPTEDDEALVRLNGIITPPIACDIPFGNGSFRCAEATPSAMRVVYDSSGFLIEKRVFPNGRTELVSRTPSPESYFQVLQSPVPSLVKFKYFDSQPIFSKPIPASLTNRFGGFLAAGEVNFSLPSGQTATYALVATDRINPEIKSDSIFLIFTDLDVNPLRITRVPMPHATGFLVSLGNSSLQQVNSEALAFSLNFQQISPVNELHFRVFHVDKNFQNWSSQNLINNPYQFNSARLRQPLCNPSTATIELRQNTLCHRGECFLDSTFVGGFSVNGTFAPLRKRSRFHQVTMGVGEQINGWRLLRPDGMHWTMTQRQPFALPVAPQNDTVRVVRFFGPIEQERFALKIPNATQIIEFQEFNGSLYLLWQGADGALRLRRAECFKVADGGNPTPKPDLELSLSASPSAPGQWKDVVLTMTLKNAGTQAATGVEVKFPGQDTPSFSNLLAYQSHTASAGTNFNYWTGVWTVGTLAAGQQAQVVYRCFTKTAGGIPIFAQVTQQAPGDLDSAPGNNSTGTPAEDDEARTVINGSNLLAPGDRKLEEIEKLEIEKLDGFTVFPNPAGEQVFVKTPLDFDGKILIFNQLGKLTTDFSNFKIEKNGASGLLALPLSGFQNGSYFLIFESPGERRVVKKLVVARTF